MNSKTQISDVIITISYAVCTCTYLQFDEQLEVKFDGTKVVDLPQDHCSCKPRQGAYQDISLHL